MIRPPPSSTLFPYTTPFRSPRPIVDRGGRMGATRRADVVWQGDLVGGSGTIEHVGSGAFGDLPVTWASRTERDRKSTRLNSSHANISYAVFCLKKKNGCILV